MTPLSFFLLALTVSLGSLRAVLSKGVSRTEFGSRSFFLSQSLLFGVGAVILSAISIGDIFTISYSGIFFALLYAPALILAQWCYTAALGKGAVGMCATVYSLGFIIPTLSGCIFFDERISVVNGIGIALVIPTVIISGMGKSGERKGEGNGYFIPLIVAMLSSGALGLIQKLQQSSSHPEDKGAFLSLSFIIAFLISFISFFITKRDKGESVERSTVIFGSLVGVCFALCNILNTTLAGLLPSALFFPVSNLGTIVLSLLLGIIIYKDSFGKREGAVLVLGAVAVLLLGV